MAKPLIVMKKDGSSYVELGYHAEHYYLVNGKPPVLCPGNSDWAMVEGDLISLERIVPAKRELVGFCLKEEFVGVVTIAEQLPADAFTFDFDESEWTGERAELYQPVYLDVPQGTTPVEFHVIDYDCEPVKMPPYVEVDFPANLKFHRAVQHKYPCRVPMKQVFDLVAEAVVAEVNKHPEIYRLHDCRNIQVLKVTAILKTAPRKERIDVSRVGARRPKWKTVTETTITKEVLSIVGEYRDKANAIQIREVAGENYKDLKAKLEAYIQSFVELIDPRQWCVCDKCNGEGVVLAGKV